MAAILIVPGYQNSGPGHWQSLWEGSLREAKRVEMPNWDFPHKVDWVEALDEAIADCVTPPILVGHSLGCLAIAHWAGSHDREIQGALMAAPADPERPDAPPAIRGFAPIPRLRLPFETILAASADDPHMTLARARALAADWGARFVDLGPCGPLNLASGHGPWPRGEALLSEFR
ncbi:RBBP9/YdeN family alpha/beta hydrolase [Geothrix oryzisoli]|uniref:RBBP9/YdeN family alpha/beta hydrolase n=1 Tax=Geothrix oryzisoli TaxID=2922721 RepID=UPI001FAD62B7|nr:alpha/beta fold hydrolase [Geothrix oryzisoli]